MNDKKVQLKVKRNKSPIKKWNDIKWFPTIAPFTWHISVGIYQINTSPVSFIIILWNLYSRNNRWKFYYVQLRPCLLCVLCLSCVASGTTAGRGAGQSGADFSVSGIAGGWGWLNTMLFRIAPRCWDPPASTRSSPRGFVSGRPVCPRIMWMGVIAWVH